MKIQPVGHGVKPDGKIPAAGKKATAAKVEPDVDRYIPGKREKALTYTKAPDQAAMDKLKAESSSALQSLRKVVVDLLRRQGFSAGMWRESGLAVDEEARLEAQKLIADDGPLGAEAVSERIVEFAKAVSGGDKSRLDELRAAIEKGFSQAESMLGGLPEVSQRTYSLVMEKLDRWAAEE